MESRFSTYSLNIFLLPRHVMAVLLGAFFVFFFVNISYSATANINFSGYVPPKTTSKTIKYPDPIYSFSDKVALPVFSKADNASSNRKISVFLGNGHNKNGKPVRFETISYIGNANLVQQAVVINMPMARQTYYICYGKVKSISRGCVAFNAIKLK